MKQPIFTNYLNPKTGQTSRFEYEETDSFDDIDPQQVKQVYAVCFINGNIIVVNNGFTWTLPGGTREAGESIEQTLRREIQEETNMEIVEWKPIGVQTVFEDKNTPYLQIRIACRVVPIGPFIHDPAGDVTEIKLIPIKEYKKYFDWGEIGEAIINRADKLFGNTTT